MNSELEKYLPLVDFLASFLGEDAEVVLHDVNDLDESVVAIKNNHISNREIGAPATNLVLKILKDAKLSKKDYLCDYQSKAQTQMKLKSGTYFIKNDEKKIIGMLCINMDLSKYANLKDSLDKLFPNQIESKDTISENLSSSAKEITLDSIKDVIVSKHVLPERMTKEEKENVILELELKGIFMLKGAVTLAANELKVSEPTIYRYLKKVKTLEK